MATNNIIELLQETLNSKPLQKVDPNTQEVEKAAADTTHASKLQQAVIAAVLTGIYKMTRTHEGAAQLLGGNISTTWGNLLFGDSRPALVQRIVTYSVSSPAAVDAEIEMAGNEAANIIKSNAGGIRTATEDDVVTYVKSQRNNILQ